MLHKQPQKRLHFTRFPQHLRSTQSTQEYQDQLDVAQRTHVSLQQVLSSVLSVAQSSSSCFPGTAVSDNPSPSYPSPLEPAHSCTKATAVFCRTISVAPNFYSSTSWDTAMHLSIVLLSTSPNLPTTCRDGVGKRRNIFSLSEETTDTSAITHTSFKKTHTNTFVYTAAIKKEKTGVANSFR